MTEPFIGHLGLPADTITQEATNIQVVFTPGTPGKLVPTLIINTAELGVYELAMGIDVFQALVGQVVTINALGKAQLQDLTARLHQQAERDGTNPQ